MSGVSRETGHGQALPVAADAAATGPREVSPLRAWYYVILLCVLYAISFVDRLILALIADPVAQDLGLSDTQMGLLLGAGFAVIYCAVGLPMAHWIDRSRRTSLIVAGGVLFWSASTIASAFANDFTTMLICRAGIAIGEAVLGPAAMALITNLFSREKRRRPTAVYAAVNTVMKSGALILGAVAIDLALRVQHYGVDLAMWRITMIIVGLPGIAVALLLLATVRDPPRLDGGAKVSGSSTRDFVAHLSANRTFWVPFYLATGIGNIISYGAVSWIPTILTRGYGMAPSEVGYTYGIAGLTAAVSGVFFWSAISRILERGRGAGPVTGLALALTLATASAVASVLAPNAIVYLIIAMLIALGTSGLIVLMMLTIQLVGPRRMVARLLAINILVSNLVGLAGGPLVVALVAGFWAGDSFALGYALAAVSAVVGSISVLGFLLAHRRYHVLLAAQERAGDPLAADEAA